MPLRRCKDNGKPGWSWGSGKCYTYKAGDKASENAAKKKAFNQGIKIEGGPEEAAKVQKSKSRRTEIIDSITEQLKKGGEASGS